MSLKIIIFLDSVLPPYVASFVSSWTREFMNSFVTENFYSGIRLLSQPFKVGFIWDKKQSLS